jgi:hypothetical protein
MVVEATAEAQEVTATVMKTIKKKRNCRTPSHQLSSGKSPMLSGLMLLVLIRLRLPFRRL